MNEMCNSADTFLSGLMLLFVFSVADDPTDHVGVVRLGSVQQRHDCVLLVWHAF